MSNNALQSHESPQFSTVELEKLLPQLNLAQIGIWLSSLLQPVLNFLQRYHSWNPSANKLRRRVTKTLTALSKYSGEDPNTIAELIELSRRHAEGCLGLGQGFARATECLYTVFSELQVSYDLMAVDKDMSAGQQHLLQMAKFPAKVAGVLKGTPTTEYETIKKAVNEIRAILCRGGRGGGPSNSE